MMKFYIEITLIDGERSLYDLWSDLYQQVHIALADMHNKGIKNIGVSFPNYRFEQKNGRTFATLGDKLRIFMGDKDLLGIFNNDLISRLNDYMPNWDDHLHIKQIKAVPETHTFAIYQRYNPKEIEQVAERFATHKGIGFEQALSHCQTHKIAKQNYPFIILKSQSTGNHFNLHIKKTVVDKASQGEFSCYGLSANASVPEF